MMNTSALLAQLLREGNVGMSAPNQGAAVAPTPQASGSWYDASKWDPSNTTPSLNAVSNYRFEAGSAGGTNWDTGAAEQGIPDRLVSPNGQAHELTPNADGTYTFSDKYQDPSSSSKNDKQNVAYIYDPKTGVATPTGSQKSYDEGRWTKTGRPIAKMAAIAIASLLGGGALAGELAAPAAEGAAIGGGGGGGAAALGEGGTYALGSGLAPYGGIAEAGGSFAGGAAVPTAEGLAGGVSGVASGSGGLGAGLTGFGAGELGAGAASSSFLDQLYSKGGDYLKDKATDPNTYKSLLDGYMNKNGGGSVSTSGGGGWQAPNSTRAQLEALRKQQNAQQQNFTPTWSGAK